jgi:hypothetical protein
MVIDNVIAKRFISEYKKFLLAIYQQNPDKEAPQRLIDLLHAARHKYLANRGLLDDYMRNLEDGTEPIDRKIMMALRSLKYSRWVYLRDLKSCSIFLKEGGECGYGVLGLNDEIKAITGGPGVVLQAGVVVLDNRYVCDGLIANVIHLGRNMRNSWNDLYKDLKQSGRFHVQPLLSQRPVLKDRPDIAANLNNKR